MSFDPTHIITGLFLCAVSLAIGAAARFVRSTSDTKVAEAMTLITGKVEILGNSVMEKMDGLREALHGVATAHSVAAERHAHLSASHDKLDSRVSRIESDLYTTNHPRVAGKEGL